MVLKDLAENLGLEPEEFVELLDLFVETCEKDLNGLEAAMKEEDGDKAARAAHSIKGAAGNLGLMDLYEMARASEMEARNRSFEALPQRVQAIRARTAELARLKGH